MDPKYTIGIDWGTEEKPTVEMLALRMADAITKAHEARQGHVYVPIHPNSLYGQAIAGYGMDARLWPEKAWDELYGITQSWKKRRKRAIRMRRKKSRGY